MSSPSGSPSHMRYKDPFDPSPLDPDYAVEISNKMRVPDRISVLEDQEMQLTLQENGTGLLDPAIVSIQNNLPPKSMADEEEDRKKIGRWMQVPDRILVAGNEQHIGGRDPLPETRLDPSYSRSFTEPPVELMTPPRTLTLQDHAYPGVYMNGHDEPLMNGHRQMPEPNSNHIKRGKATPHAEPAQAASTLDTTFGNAAEAIMNSFYGQADTSLFGAAATAQDETGVIMDPTVRRQLKLLNRRVSHLERDARSRANREMFLITIGLLYGFIKGFMWLNKS